MNLDHILNFPVETRVQKHKYFAGIVGEKPSAYSKSPALWNAAFRKIGLDAIYVPFDVNTSHLKSLFATLRRSPRLLGLNVTVPHKTSVIELGLIDALDPQAERIGAVNTIARSSKGKLIGYNTDGEGAVRSLTRRLTGQSRSFLRSLSGLTVVLLGAGGSARSIAFVLAPQLGSRGRLFILNRTWKKALELSSALKKNCHNCEALRNLDELDIVLKQADLVINATSVGQSSMGSEHHSALGLMGTLKSRQADLKNNLKISQDRMKNLKHGAKLFDLIYSPSETIFLKQGRLAGHEALNGRNMMIWQAVASFFIIMKQRGLSSCSPLLERKVLQAMAAAW